MGDLRCTWCLSSDDYQQYHDNEWGLPLRDNQRMFEFLILETFQAGLNWLMILRKREAFREVFLNFDPHRVALMTADDVERLAQDKRIVRNRQKIRAAIANAQATLRLEAKGIGLSDYFWQWVDHEAVDNQGTMQTTSDLSDAIAKDLKSLGFKFVGSTTIYAHLQATGIINDHQVTCPAYSVAQSLASPSQNP